MESIQSYRYGLQWNGPKEFVATPKSDGYWMPWHIADEQITTLRQQLEQAETEIKRLKQASGMKGNLAIEWKVKLDKSQSRLAQIHEASHELYSWCVENLTAEQIKDGLAIGQKIGQLLDLERPAVDAFIARKQAEEVDHIMSEIARMAPRRLSRVGLAGDLQAEAQRLRQQADEIEKAGGEK